MEGCKDYSTAQKADHLNPKKYRPFAILPVLSKMLERVVLAQISQYMEFNALLHPNHHGFRSSHSTSTCIIQMYDKCIESLQLDTFKGVWLVKCIPN